MSHLLTPEQLQQVTDISKDLSEEIWKNIQQQFAADKKKQKILMQNLTKALVLTAYRRGFVDGAQLFKTIENIEEAKKKEQKQDGAKIIDLDNKQ